MKILLIFFLLLQLSQSSCPTGFELVRDGECRGNYTRINTFWDQLTNDVMAKCKEIDAQPIIIHNEEHQSYWTRQTAAGNIGWSSIGLLCNQKSTRWEWADGSALDFKPPSGQYVSALDQSCSTGFSWDLHNDGFWGYFDNKQTPLTADVFCTTQLVQPIPNGDGCDGFEDDSDDGVCYQVEATVGTWQDAQTKCKMLGANLASIHNSQENSFVRRLAVSNGAVNGLFLGATVSGKGSTFGWLDGSEWNYDNFYPGFPMNGLGDCVAMDTEGTSGQWMNTNCNTNLSVACVREPRTPSCSSGPWVEGEIITSPGFPFTASIPCDFFLMVDPGKNVEVEISFLEANSCCDSLIINDNYIGGNVVANLTGEISSKKYTTKSSNLARVSWLPNGGVNVRGAMFTYRGV